MHKRPLNLKSPFPALAVGILCITSFAFTDCAKKSAPSAMVYKRPATPPPPARHPTGPVLLHGNLPSDMKGMENDILYYVNRDREARGLKPLQLNAFESGVAAQHSRNMASGRTPFGHKGLQLRMNTIERQIGPLKATGENVAYGQMSAREVVDEWLNSPMHKKNIEGDYTLTGIGWAKDKEGMIYYTQIFTR